MEDFADRTINELVESYPIFVDALKEEYNILANMLDIIFSSCSIKTKDERLIFNNKKIIYKVYDCFFEYQIYKIMEKFRYYKKIENQTEVVAQILRRRRGLNLKINFEYQNLFHKIVDVVYYTMDKTIKIYFAEFIYEIEVEEKYHQDMINLVDVNNRL